MASVFNNILFIIHNSKKDKKFKNMKKLFQIHRRTAPKRKIIGLYRKRKSQLLEINSEYIKVRKKAPLNQDKNSAISSNKKILFNRKNWRTFNRSTFLRAQKQKKYKIPY